MIGSYMGQAMRSVSQNPFGVALPPDVAAAAVERLNDIVMVTETDLVEPGPRILYVNPAFERITGYSSDEVIGRSPRFLQGTGTSEEEIRRIEGLMRARRPVRTELLNIRKDGSQLWLEIEVTAITSPSAPGEYFVFIERDITRRKRAEVALLEQQRAMSTLFSNLPGMAYRCKDDGLWTMDFVSAGSNDLTGYPPEAFTGERSVSYEGLIEPEDRKAVRANIARALERGEAFELTYRIRSREGALKWVWERGRSVPVPESRARYLDGFITDITEQKMLENQIVQSQRLESIGTLAGGIAHDLNNVFAPIMMAGDLLIDKARDDETSQLLATVAASARRGAGLVRQILLFARGMEGRRIAVDPATLFAEAKAFLESTLPKSIRVDVEVAPGVAAISGDPAQLHQLLLNLSLNARDAMPSGGRLALTASSYSVSPSAPRPHPDAVPGDFVRVDVSDTGSGIPDILKSRIFDPFFTTKGVGRGTGLGLSTAHAIVKAHCGFITFVSAQGAGTTFSIFLPTAAAGLSKPARDDGAKQDSGPLPRSKGEHVLVVDDEESVRQIMRNTLEAFGYRVTTASDGAEAIALIRNSTDQFDLAVVDIQMPGLDGGQTIVALRHIRPSMAIVGSSGMATAQNRELMAANGVRHFLDKPFSVETMIRTVHAAIAKTAP
jgi:PAS domain S-box-containing protein